MTYCGLLSSTNLRYYMHMNDIEEAPNRRVVLYMTATEYQLLTEAAVRERRSRSAQARVFIAAGIGLEDDGQPQPAPEGS